MDVAFNHYVLYTVNLVFEMDLKGVICNLTVRILLNKIISGTKEIVVNVFKDILWSNPT